MSHRRFYKRVKVSSIDDKTGHKMRKLCFFLQFLYYRTISIWSISVLPCIWKSIFFVMQTDAAWRYGMFVGCIGTSRCQTIKNTYAFISFPHVIRIRENVCILWLNVCDGSHNSRRMEWRRRIFTWFFPLRAFIRFNVANNCTTFNCIETDEMVHKNTSGRRSSVERIPSGNQSYHTIHEINLVWRPTNMRPERSVMDFFVIFFSTKKKYEKVNFNLVFKGLRKQLFTEEKKKEKITHHSLCRPLYRQTVKLMPDILRPILHSKKNERGISASS